ncbi:hypothetical protein BDW74DRAFT_188498 [Aspergillus multicolor]|uniref:uncharacterized protein n=1 Tax=Aspergillus multicolor TaxID=41759 RepID=UPI003CCD0D23
MDNSTWVTAPYGRACASCAQAKCKCLVTEGGGSCARCCRLNRDCYPARRTRKMNAMRRSVAAKTAQLERRLDELTSLVQSGQGTGQPTAPAYPTGPNTASSDSGFSSFSQSSPKQLVYSSRETCRPFGLDAANEDILSDFRSNRLPYLPFIYIPNGVPASEIRSEYPFLWRCLIMLHCKDLVKRGALHEELKATAAKALLVDCQRSLDLLLGLIVYLAWIGFERQPRRMALGPYVQMLTGLVLDMELNRPAPPPLDAQAAQFAKAGTGSCRPGWVSPVRTMQERRAILGCFLVCSAVSHTLRRTDSLRWTPHMKECIDVLMEANETPNDIVLVQLVRTQLVVDKVFKDLGYYNDAVGDHRNAPLALYLKGLQSELDDIRAHPPSEPFQKDILLLHLHHAETTIYETALKQSPAAGADLTRLESVYACLSAVQKRFEILLGLSPASFGFHPSTVEFPTAHSLLTLLRLSTLEYPGWDYHVIRQTVDLLDVTEQVADKLGRAADAIGLRNPNPIPNLHDRNADIDCFTMTSRILLGLKAGWAERLPAAAPEDGPVGSFPGRVPPAPAPPPVPALPEIDQHMIDTWLPSQDLAWMAEFTPFGMFS